MREGEKNARVFTCGENEENEREKKREKIGWSFDKENKKCEGSTCGVKRNEREKKNWLVV